MIPGAPQFEKTTPSILTVTQLTLEIKQLLEEKYSVIWISGEISNLRIPASGHAYLTLKDAKAQISAVMFKGQLRNLSFNLEDGVSITAMGRVSVYEPRGTYQIILEYAERQGYGALQLAFEQLKRKLAAEGLFEQSAKITLPFLPRTIGLITSPTGAVVRDMLHVIHRRYSNMQVEIIPVRVQGAGAENDIARALALANRRNRCDVIIVARGGGSIEDLFPFNSETVARAIFASRIPIVSAIGHETDFTIADFVADLRAPTPSVAAELVSPIKTDLIYRVMELHRRCFQALRLKVQKYQREFLLVQRSLVHPKKRVQEMQIRCDDLTRQLHHHLLLIRRECKSDLELTRLHLYRMSPLKNIIHAKAKMEKSATALDFAMKNVLSRIKEKLGNFQIKLELLNPGLLLKNGYSITRTLPDRKVVISADGIATNQELEVVLYQGVLHVSVRQSEP